MLLDLHIISSSLHCRYLQRYKKTGQCTIMNTTRVVTALHREVRCLACLDVFLRAIPCSSAAGLMLQLRSWTYGGSALPQAAWLTAICWPPLAARCLRQGHSFPLQMSLKEVKQGDTKAYMVRWDGMGWDAADCTALCTC